MSASKENKKNTVLLNKLFTGAWLNDPLHVDHGVINMFRADPAEDGGKRSYIYITPNGSVPNPDSIEAVLFVENISGAGETIEVLAAAREVESNDETDAEKVMYMNTKLSDLFQNDFASKVPLTFESRSGVFAPRRRIIINVGTMDESKDFPEDAIVLFFGTSKKSFISRMRAYYSRDRKNDEQVYSKLKGLLESETIGDLGKLFGSSVKKPLDYSDKEKLWEERRDSFSEVSILDQNKDQFASLQPSFLEIINKSNDELVFSNLLKYYFELNRAVFHDFAKEVLWKESKTNEINFPDFSEKYKVIRESMFNIDLWIEDDKNVVVIENKIKSDIQVYENNKEGYKSQLEKYYDKTENHESERAEKNHLKKRKTWYYLLSPTYNKKKLSLYSYGEKYKQITYDQLFDFFKKHEKEYSEDPYFRDFMIGLKRHTLSPAGLNYEIAKARFSKMIKDAETNEADCHLN